MFDSKPNNICFAIRRQQIQLKGRALLFILLILLDYFLGLLSLLFGIKFGIKIMAILAQKVT